MSSVLSGNNNWVTPDGSIAVDVVTYPQGTYPAGGQNDVQGSKGSLRSSFNMNNAVSNFENVSMYLQKPIISPSPQVAPKVYSSGPSSVTYRRGPPSVTYRTPPSVAYRTPPSVTARQRPVTTTAKRMSSSELKSGNSVLSALTMGRKMEEVRALVNLGNDLNLVGQELEEYGSLVHFCLYMGIDDSLTIAILSHPWFRQVNRLCPSTGGTCLHVAAALERKEVCYAILERFDFNQLITRDLLQKEAKDYCRRSKRKGQKIRFAIEQHPMYKSLKEAENLLKARLTKMNSTEKDITSVMNVDPSSSILSLLVDANVFGSQSEAAVQTSKISEGEEKFRESSIAASVLSDKEILRRRHFLRDHGKPNERLGSGKSELNSTQQYLEESSVSSAPRMTGTSTLKHLYDDLSSMNSSEESSIDFNLLRNATDEELLQILKVNLSAAKQPTRASGRRDEDSDPYSLLEAHYHKGPESSINYRKNIINIKPNGYGQKSFVI